MLNHHICACLINSMIIRLVTGHNPHAHKYILFLIALTRVGLKMFGGRIDSYIREPYRVNPLDTV